MSQAGTVVLLRTEELDCNELMTLGVSIRDPTNQMVKGSLLFILLPAIGK